MTMRRTALIFIGTLAIALVGCNGSSQSPGDPGQKPAAPPAKPTKQNAAPPAPTNVSEAPSAPIRRQRAGIEAAPETPPKGPTTARSPGTPPAMETTLQFTAAKRAYQLLQGPWLDAMRQQDPKTLTKLLAEDFQGSAVAEGGKMKQYDLSGWIGLLKDSPKDTKASYSYPDTVVLPGPNQRVTIRWNERVKRGESCVLKTRETTVHVAPNGDALIANDTLGKPKACPKDPAIDVAAAHTRLKRAAKAGKNLAPFLWNETIWLKQSGLTAGQLKASDLERESARWIIAALDATDADLDTTTVFGDRGQISQAQNIVFVYRAKGKAWLLAGVGR